MSGWSPSERFDEADWERFNAPKADQLWYYDALIEAFERTGTRSGHFEELKRVVAALKSASPRP